jgi:uncharacterized repeat protein (TIGR01451 family)
MMVDGFPEKAYEEQMNNKAASGLVLAVLVSLAFGVGGASAALNPDSLTVTLSGRNVTWGQSAEYATVNARPGNTLEFVVRVRSRSGGNLHNVWVSDQLPAGLHYIGNTTSLNGYLTGDGISGPGLNIGTLAPGQESVVRYSVLVDGGSVPVSGAVMTTNSIRVSADTAATVGASMKVSFGVVPATLGASGVRTGPGSSLVLSLAAATLVTGLYAAYSRTGIFRSRMAISEIARICGGTMNFVR